MASGMVVSLISALIIHLVHLKTSLVMRLLLFLIICVSFCWSDKAKKPNSVNLKFSPFLMKSDIFSSEKRDEKHPKDGNILKESRKESEEGYNPTFEAHNRIFGGGIAPRNAYPYQVGLSIKRGSKGTWCGGSIISDRYIITAAHCVDKASSVNVILGGHDRTNSNEKGRIETTVTKRNIMIHEKWDRGKLTNDIAIIKLSSRIKFTDNIQPVYLPPDDNDILEEEIGVISGWGHFDRTKQLSQYLRYSYSEIISNSACKRYYSSHVKDTNVCLDGSKGNTTCNGDSGGPLVVTWVETEPTLVGLTSFGSSRGCSRGYPTVFTRLSSYLDWINSKTGV